jgi:putative hemolysin
MASIWAGSTPLSELKWSEEDLTPQDLVGSSTVRYTAGDWVVTVTYPIVAPEDTIYQVGIVNSASGLTWSGEVDAEGNVREVTGGSADMPNPASVYCEEQGGTVEIRTDADGGQVGVCIFPDGSECDEWAFFRGECAPGDFPIDTGMPNPASVYCEEEGGTVEIRTDADGGQVGVCIFPDGSECDEWAFFRGECAPGDFPPTGVPLDQEAAYEGVRFFYNQAIAAGVAGETVAAEEYMSGEVIPEHVRFSFSGYTLAGAFHDPRIIVYPVSAFAADGMAADTAASLRSLLDSGQLPAPGGGFAGATIPFLPLFNAGQLLHTQMAFLDFQNGRGVRFLTEYAQYFAPINNTDLFYTFQGLTDDGEFYVAAILPVAHPSLPADASQIPGGDPEAFADAYDTYANDMAVQLAGYGSSEFTPDLALLDGLIASLEAAP